jgi:hypothetical protein
MLTQARDTHPEAERVQLELLRQATPERRLELGLTLCEEGLAIAHHAISQANPLLSEEECRLIFVEVTYGKDLADRVRAYLAGRQK